MRRLLITLLSVAALVGCTSITPVGELSVATLQRTAPAFARAETTDPTELSALRAALAHSGPTELTVFFGDWCSDSQREVPRLLALIDALPPEQVKLTLINLPRDKAARSGLVGNVTLERIPTIIISQHGKELGRIVERPTTTLASDWLALLPSTSP